jgi:hypothetical protein
MLIPSETENLLAEFAVRQNLTGFQPDSMGRYTLMVDDWKVWAFHSGRVLYLEATLGGLPPEQPLDSDPLVGMLSVSLSGLADHEEVLTVTHQDDEGAETGESLRLYRRLPLASLDLAGFEQALESFVNRLEHWNAVLTRTPRTPEPPMPMYILFP